MENDLPTVWATRQKIVSCKEYGFFEIEPSLILKPDGTLNIRKNVLDRHITAGFKNGSLRLQAKGTCGVFPINDQILLQVQPRFPIGNLAHMITVCGKTPESLTALRPYSAYPSMESWMLDVITSTMIERVDNVIEMGLWGQYREYNSSSSHPHGKIDFKTTISRYASRGVQHKIAYSWSQRSIDNAPNRAIKCAILELHRLNTESGLTQRGVRKNISRLSNTLQLLKAIPNDKSRNFLADPFVKGECPLPESKFYYRPALDLAAMILRGQGLDLNTFNGFLQAMSLSVETEKLFEDFVRVSLSRRLDHRGLKVIDGNMQEGKRNLYERPGPNVNFPVPYTPVKKSPANATPDLLVMTPTGKIPIAADMKYTRSVDYANRSEVEQVMLYAELYSSPIAMTVHPQEVGTSGGLIVSGQIGEKLVTQYRINLAAENLEEEMDLFARDLLLLARTAAHPGDWADSNQLSLGLDLPQ